MSSSSWPRICPFSVGLFVASAIIAARALGESSSSNKEQPEAKDTSNKTPSFTVVFILGAPGVGKGTQCQLLCERLKDYHMHLSAGDLLRAERKKTNSALAQEINECISAGKIVRSEITCQILQNAMRDAYEKTNVTNFLIDGYPRNQGNVDAWEQSEMKNATVAFVLNFVCPEDTLIGRLLERGKSSGRGDDNLETVQKRFRHYQEEELPIIQWYKDKTDIPVYDIATDKPVEKVYQETVQYFSG